MSAFDQVALSTFCFVGGCGTIALSPLFADYRALVFIMSTATVAVMVSAIAMFNVLAATEVGGLTLAVKAMAYMMAWFLVNIMTAVWLDRRP